MLKKNMCIEVKGKTYTIMRILERRDEKEWEVTLDRDLEIFSASVLIEIEGKVAWITSRHKRLSMFKHIVNIRFLPEEGEYGL